MCAKSHSPDGASCAAAPLGSQTGKTSIRHPYRGGNGSKGTDNTLAGHQKRKQRTKLRPRVWTDRGERLVEQPRDVHANVRPLPASDEIQRQTHVQRGRRDLPRR